MATRSISNFSQEENDSYHPKMELIDDLTSCIARIRALTQVALHSDFTQNTSSVMYHYWYVFSDELIEAETLCDELQSWF